MSEPEHSGVSDLKFKLVDDDIASQLEAQMERGGKVYRALELCESSDRNRRCPKCLTDDVRLAIHSRSVTSVDFSFSCTECKNSESSLADDCETVKFVFENWYQ